MGFKNINDIESKEVTFGLKDDAEKFLKRVTFLRTPILKVTMGKESEYRSYLLAKKWLDPKEEFKDAIKKMESKCHWTAAMIETFKKTVAHYKAGPNPSANESWLDIVNAKNLG